MATKWLNLKYADELDGPTHTEYLVDGILPDRQLVWLSAKAKVGKTTFLTALINALESGEDFCGRQVKPARVILLTEEPAHVWKVRHAQGKVPDNIEIQSNPFTPGKPTPDQWLELCQEIEDYIDLADEAWSFYESEKEGHFDPLRFLIVIDTIANLGPILDEQSNSEVPGYMNPLRALTKRAAVLVNHHHGHEASHSRGASAILGAVDVVIDMYNTEPANRQNRRRRLDIAGRPSDLVTTMTVELDPDGLHYTPVFGNTQDDQEQGPTSSDIVLDILKKSGKWLSATGVLEAWPEKTKPTTNYIYKTLATLAKSSESVKTQNAPGKGHAKLYRWTSLGLTPDS